MKALAWGAKNSVFFDIIEAVQSGQIIKLLGGFYTVKTESGEIFETRARGNFRKRGLAPVVGDFVDFENDYILEIHARKNELIRPQIANIDQMIVVMSSVSPDFSRNLLDRYLAYLENKRIAAIIYLTKQDILTNYAEIAKDYETIGYSVLQEPQALVELLQGKTTAFMGQTGAGKSTLLNKIAPNLELATAETSDKLGRGRHTTRHVELYAIDCAQIADTPGFSSLDYDIDNPPDLNRSFIDIYKLSAGCKFRECTHTHEPECAVKVALETHDLLQSRYDNYCQLLTEINHTRETYAKNAKKQ